MNNDSAGQGPHERPVVPLLARLRALADLRRLEGDDAEAELVDEAVQELHNLAWALSLPGFDRMATNEQEAEHQAGVQRVNEVLARMENAKAEHDAAMADAARYRWLRAQHWNDGLLAVVADPKDAVKLGHDCPSLDRLDAAIDAAMLAQQALGAA